MPMKRDTCQLDALSRDAQFRTPLSHRLKNLRRYGVKIVRKLRTMSEDSRGLVRFHVQEARARPAVVVPPLRLQPGERVRVKSLDEIEETLDAHGAYERCYYVAASMNEYAGKVFTVLKRVDTFYDERERRMCKTKNTVLLRGVHCRGMPAAGFDEDWKGCDRMCLLFWKEAWLERVVSD